LFLVVIVKSKLSPRITFELDNLAPVITGCDFTSDENEKYN
jgi:hypothetical protein